MASIVTKFIKKEISNIVDNTDEMKRRIKVIEEEKEILDKEKEDLLLEIRKKDELMTELRGALYILNKI